MAKSRLVADRVIASLDLKTTADALLGSISVKVPLDTAEIRVTAQSSDPAMAQRVADAWVNGLAAQVRAIETATTADGATSSTGSGGKVPAAAASPASAISILPLGKAVLPTTPVSPNVKLSLALGACIGLALGVAYAMVCHHLDRRIRNAAEIERLFGVPVIGTLPVDHRLDGKSIILEAGPSLRSMMLAPPAVRWGRPSGNCAPTSASWMWTSLRGSSWSPAPSRERASPPSRRTSLPPWRPPEKNVVVVDGDLRRPTLVDVFNLVPGVGVTEVLAGTAELGDVLQPWGALPNLSVLGSGRIPPNPSELLGSLAMKNMLSALAQNAAVLIDAPPLLPVTDAAVLSRVADGAIVVIQTGRTTQEQLAQSLGNLAKVRGRVLGTVLNHVPTHGTDAYSYYATYASAAEPARREPSLRGAAVGDVSVGSATGVLEPVPAGRRDRG